jgi:drug/metabolite transporter (DMT)-like permease
MLAASVRRFGPTSINVYKSVLTAALFLVTLVVMTTPEKILGAASSWPWFALSGIVGLAIGDTAYFVSLGRLGPSIALILYQLSAVFGLALGVVFNGEEPVPGQLVGTALVVGGVIFATYRRGDAAAADSRTAEEIAARRRAVRQGVWGGLISSAAQATGLLINQKAWSVATESGFARDSATGAVFAASGRMTATAIALLLACAALGRFKTETRPLVEREGWKLTFFPAFLGTYLGILSMQSAVANLELGVASTLLATSPIFVIPSAWILAGERPTWRKTTGALIATAGVALISLAKA